MVSTWEAHDITTVRRLVRQWVQGRQEPFWGDVPLRPVAEELGVVYASVDGTTAAGKRLLGQITRTLDEMSGEPGSDMPLIREVRLTGHGRSRAARYTPTGYWRKQEEDRQRAEQARAEVRRAWEDVNAALAAEGYVTLGARTTAPEFDLDTWQRLTAQATRKDIHP